MKTAFHWLLPCGLVLATGCATEHREAAYRYQNPDGTTVISSAPSPYATGSSGNYADTYPSTTYGTTSSTTTYPAYSSNQYSSGDDSLIRQVRQQLNSYGRLGTIAQTVQVNAQNGIVTISGVVPTQQDRDMINEVVRDTPGVVSVTDQLHVSNWSTGSSSSYNRVYPGSQPQAVTADNAGQIFSLNVQGLTPADRALAQRVINGLETDSALPNVLPKVNIEVADGRIILRGTVQNEQQRRAIEDAVRRAAGVSAVDDQLQIIGQ